MKAIRLIIGLLLLSATAVAQAVLPVQADFEGVTIKEPFLHQLRQPSSLPHSPTALPTDSARWEPVASVNYGRRHFVGWARFSVQSTTAQPVWLELTTHFLDSVAVYMATPNLPPVRVRGPESYRQQASGLAPVNHHYFLYALNLPARQPVTVWIRARVLPGDAMKYEVKLWSPKQFLAAQQRDIWGWAIYVGIVLSILAGVLIAWFFYRRPLYLLYACYVLCLSSYALLNDGWGAYLPDSLAWFDNITTIVHWLNIGFAAFCMFSRRFLNVARKPGLLRFRWPEGVPMLVVFGVTMLAHWAQQRDYEGTLKIAYAIGYAGFAGYGLIWLLYVVDAFRRGFRLVWLLILAVSTVLVFFAVNAFVINLGLMRNPLPDMVALRIALLAELTILSAGWLYRRRLMQTARQQLEIQNHALQEALIQTQETERQRIAADLHDDLGGTLATVYRRITDLNQYQPNTQISQQLSQIIPLIQKSNDDIRRISHNLMPPEFARIGLRHALEQLILSQPNQPTHFSFFIAGVEQKLPLETELNAYRIVSEFVQNINKHAQASRASVQLLYKSDWLSVLVEDDGLGSRAKTSSDEPMGIGLKNSSLRAEYIGATLWRDVSEAGTLVVLDIPYPLPPDDAPNPNPDH